MRDNALPCAGEIMEAVKTMMATGRAAWKTGLMAGFSGNMSMRLACGDILVTASGSVKGDLRPDNFILLDVSGARICGAGEPSTETPLHLGIYAAFAECMAIVHTHPARMQSLELVLKEKQKDMAGHFFNMNLHEAEIWRERLVFSGQGKPGSQEMAESAINSLREILPGPLPCAAWLPGHGLCALATTCGHALAITEEMEHLAGIQLVAGTF